MKNLLSGSRCDFPVPLSLIVVIILSLFGKLHRTSEKHTETVEYALNLQYFISRQTGFL
ncbi:hypothetical protein HOLleu_38724 [Holothuria leucospilota]|uniref:Uncharacterized protein n=1 Tax=Holothuria leucospilota TaxID=206669 RepID=A0A9Q0YJ31_HOLLE|nr:hypothetical protein HOLleu_38724 [Holothuria leucospilota]